jgi:hypothetical protein
MANPLSGKSLPIDLMKYFLFMIAVPALAIAGSIVDPGAKTVSVLIKSISIEIPKEAPQDKMSCVLNFDQNVRKLDISIISIKKAEIDKGKKITTIKTFEQIDVSSMEVDGAIEDIGLNNIYCKFSSGVDDLSGMEISIAKHRVELAGIAELKGVSPSVNMLFCAGDMIPIGSSKDSFFH